MKKLDDICFIVQARLNSQRVPQKMVKSFKGSKKSTTLFDLILDKLLNSKVIPKSNIIASVYEPELAKIANNKGVFIFKRSHKSANEDNSLQTIYEWHDKLPYKYVVLISGCNPLLKIETIDNFVTQYMSSDKDGAFAVFEKRTYYWDKLGIPITDWKKANIMNTKIVEPIYEAAHCLYASKLDIIKEGHWMDINYPPQPELFVMDELEAFDIDYEWQFKLGEKLYYEEDKN